MWGLDMRNGSDIAYDLHGQYTTDIIGRESVRIIERHNVSQPLFLYMAHAAVHSGVFRLIQHSFKSAPSTCWKISAVILVYTLN